MKTNRAKIIAVLLLASLSISPAPASPGDVDLSFDAGLAFNPGRYFFSPRDSIRSAAFQSDGKVLLAGRFQSIGGQPRHNVARINADGSLDSSFSAGTGGDTTSIDPATSMALQKDGRILIGGWVTSINGESRNFIARLLSDGSLDESFDPGLGPDRGVQSIALQNDGKILIGGYFNSISGAPRQRIARLNADGGLDPTFDAGSVMGPFVWCIALQPDGKVVIGGGFDRIQGINRPGVARLNPDGSLDSSFNAQVGGPYTTVYSLALQGDGKLLLGGNFQIVGGASRRGIARLNANGSLDASFNPGGGVNFSGAGECGSDGRGVDSVALQADGKILIGGRFEKINGVNRNGIARLNADGSLDSDFNPVSAEDSTISLAGVQSDGRILIAGHFSAAQPGISRFNADGTLDEEFIFDPGSGINGEVMTMAMQNDGKVIIGGGFSLVNRLRRKGFARLNRDGSLDDTFQINVGVRTSVSGWCVAVQSDNKLLIGGPFTSVNGTERAGMARLNPDGSLDPGFSPVFATGASPCDLYGFPSHFGWVSGMAVQRNSQILIRGGFSSVNGVPRNGFARLNEDGTLDPGFNPAADGTRCFAIQEDEKILIGGTFTSVNALSRNRIARLYPDGSLDTSFDAGTGPDRTVNSVTVQSDGKILIAGSFRSVNGFSRNRIARLMPDGSLDVAFDTSGIDINDEIRSITEQMDGKIVFTGAFSLIDGVAYDAIARLNTDGTLDTSFHPQLGGHGRYANVSALPQPDGSLVIAGDFFSVNGVPRAYIARLHGGDAPPHLRINRAGNEMLLTWPAEAEGFVLESSSTLREEDWRSVPGTPLLLGSTKAVVTRPSGQAQFFRLKRP
jgi:uncharacterized delta-60 repeat protein